MNRHLIKKCKNIYYRFLVLEYHDSFCSEIKETKMKRIERGEYDLCFGVIANTHVGVNGNYPNHQRFEKVLD